MKKQFIALFVGLLVAVSVSAEAPPMPQDMIQEAQSGQPEAQLELGILYEYGFDMKDNKISALAWYMKSAEQGNARAIRYRDKLQDKMTSTQVQRARDLAATLAVSPPAN